MAGIDDAQIKYMVDRFLRWRLPKDFSPDAGIRFEPSVEMQDDPLYTALWPSGTNLFTATQATEMVRYMVSELPNPQATKDEGQDE